MHSITAHYANTTATAARVTNSVRGQITVALSPGPVVWSENE